MTAQVPVNLPLSDMLARVSDELASCRTMLLVIEDLIQPELTATPSPLASRVRLQDIDMLAQVLGELASCLDTVSSDLTSSAIGQRNVRPAVDALRLEGLRNRLIGAFGNDVEAEPVELF